MLKKSLFVATAIILGTFGTANAAGNAAGAATKFAKTELSCQSGTTCSVRIQLPANKLIRLRGISCVGLSANVTSADLQIVQNGIIEFEALLFVRDLAGNQIRVAEYLWYQQNLAIYTGARELWLNLQSTVPGQLAATCYAAF